MHEALRRLRAFEIGDRVVARVHGREPRWMSGKIDCFGSVDTAPCAFVIFDEPFTRNDRTTATFSWCRLSEMRFR